jgi:hypothetical protein
MQLLLNYLLVLIPTVGLIAGLSLGITIPLFLAASLYLLKNKVKIHLTKIRLEIVFFILLCISSVWSIKPLVSYGSFLSVFSISIVNKIKKLIIFPPDLRLNVTHIF